MAKRKNGELTGPVRPVFDQHRWKSERNIILRILARPDHWASVFFYLFHNVALFRISFEIVAVVAIVVTVFGVFSEYQERSKDRAVRGAMLLAQIHQLRSLPIEERDAPLHAIVEALSRDGFPLDRIDLSDMILNDLDLSGASLRRANFDDVQILNVKFRGSNLRETTFKHGKISGADFRYANLEGATFWSANNIKNVDFSNSNLTSVIFSDTNIDGSVNFQNARLDNVSFIRTNLSNADLSAARGLKPEQLKTACAMPNEIPKLPESIHWKGKRCNSQ